MRYLFYIFRKKKIARGCGGSWWKKKKAWALNEKKKDSARFASSPIILNRIKKERLSWGLQGLQVPRLSWCVLIPVDVMSTLFFKKTELIWSHLIPSTLFFNRVDWCTLFLNVDAIITKCWRYFKELSTPLLDTVAAVRRRCRRFPNILQRVALFLAIIATMNYHP